MRVLVADDDRGVRMALRVYLEERDLAVVGEATTAQEIGPLVERLRPDLLVLDWDLPGLAEAGWAQVPGWARVLRVVALSSWPTASAGQSAYSVQFVCKTDSPDCLAAALSAAIRSLPGDQAPPLESDNTTSPLARRPSSARSEAGGTTFRLRLSRGCP